MSHEKLTLKSVLSAFFMNDDIKLEIMFKEHDTEISSKVAEIEKTVSDKVLQGRVSLIKADSENTLRVTVRPDE